MPYSELKKRTIERRKYVLQSTKPQTLAYGLVNLLVALLGWIYEKLHDWSDEYPWTNDEILTWDQELLRESTMKPPMHTPEDKECTVGKLQQWTADVKLGLAYNPKDLENVPKLWGRTLGNVGCESHRFDRHFYSHEKPDLLVRDLRAMFGKGGGAFSMVNGRDGY
ncbi:uncharacterized protein EAF01_011479 [Botrytis porri]|uniref:uncharacterized protein n=1 Tax=Botrytis porri TaxID=87229 RepID=UPI0019009C8A|nr:uncharacterized protein EAF01_011479 [Botrytis porri]KAF7884056.1 hypothetical protein EAF01_011479 [Botrytis porri]